ncbi:hypothetical protein ACPA54_03115 [Uniformispora flossi]|uniref:hypothetical protein n=1 Tax=Uniformispora flossi TaxID=3390723 RepID=UPI003C2B3C62
MTADHGTSGGAAHPAPSDRGIVRTGEWFGIANEFTGVRLRKVWTPQGERLEIEVPRQGTSILLDAMQLEIVAAQSPEAFSDLFAIRMGAADDLAEAPRGDRPGDEAGDLPGGKAVDEAGAEDVRKSGNEVTPGEQPW